MDTPLVATRTWSVKSLGALRLWTIVGLLGSISMLIYLQAASIGFDPIVSGFVLLALIIAAGVAVGWRWAPVLGALWGILVLAAFGPYLIYDLTPPAVFDHLAFAVPVVRSYSRRWSPASARPSSTSAAAGGPTPQLSRARPRAGCWRSWEH